MDDLLQKMYDFARGIHGAGDVVAFVAKPIAKLSDKVLGTDLANCESCEQRRKKLNEKFPMN